MGFAVLLKSKVKMKEREKINKYLDLAWEQKKLWNVKVTVIVIINDSLRTVTKGIGGIGNQRKNQKHLHYNIVEISENAKKNPGDLIRVVATQTPVKTRIYKTQQNSRYRLYGDRDEMIDHIISKCSKLTRKDCKTRHDWVGKVIHWELCKKLKFVYTNKWHMHNPTSVLENETHKLLGDFDIQTDYRPDNQTSEKVNLQNCGLCCPGWPQSKIERK